MLKKYTLPVVTQLLTDASLLLMAGGDNESDGDGGSVQSSKSEAASDARQNFMNGMGDIFNQILESKTDISSVAYVPAGTRLIIYPKVDLWIRTAAREKEEAKDEDSGPGDLVNEKDTPTTMAEDNMPKANRGDSSNGSKVEVYGGTSSDAQPSGGGLIDPEPPAKPKVRKMPAYAATPPPSSGMSGPPPSGTSAGSSAKLF